MDGNYRQNFFECQGFFEKKLKISLFQLFSIEYTYCYIDKRFVLS